MSQFDTDHPLLSFIKSQNNEAVKLIMRMNNSWHYAVDPIKNTLLHYAAKYQNPEIVQFLIESGSNVNAKNDLKQTPLMKSFELSDLPCKRVLEILLRAGANMYLKDIAGNTLLDKVNCIEWLNEDTRRFEILKLFLEQAPYICFFEILQNGNKDIIKSLLQTDIDLSKADDDNLSLIHLLARNDNPDVIEQLHGKNFNVNQPDDDGFTPLINAAEIGNISAVQFLLNEGADIEATVYECSETALYVAIKNYNPARDYKGTVQLLLEHGANVQIETDHDENQTIFDLLLENEEFELAKLPLAHLALQEALGIVVTDLIRSKIDSNHQFKSYYKNCQQQLSMKIFLSITLLDVLTPNERKLEIYFRNKKWASKLINFQTNLKIDYFNTILGKRLAKARQIVELRVTAAPIICKRMKLDFESYPFVAHQIADYLEKQDIESLIASENETSSAIAN